MLLPPSLDELIKLDNRERIWPVWPEAEMSLVTFRTWEHFVAKHNKLYLDSFLFWSGTSEQQPVFG